MTLYSRGANFERRVKKHFEDAGWYCIKSGGSHGPADVVAIKGAKGASLVLMVQCQLDKPFNPIKKKWLRDVANNCCAFPLLAYRNGRKLEFEYVESCAVGSCDAL